MLEVMDTALLAHLKKKFDIDLRLIDRNLILIKQVRSNILEEVPYSFEASAF